MEIQVVIPEGVGFLEKRFGKQLMVIRYMKMGTTC